MDLRNVAVTDPPLRDELEAWIDNLPPADRKRTLEERDAKIRNTPRPRVWSVTDPVERRVIDEEAKVVNELLQLLRQTDAAAVLGTLEALVEGGGPEATDLAIESGLGSRHAAARAFTVRIVLARTKVLLLEPAAGQPPSDADKRATPFGLVFHQQYGLLEALGAGQRVQALLPVARLTELQAQFLFDGLLLAPFHVSDGQSVRITVNDGGEIRVESSVADLARTSRMGTVMDTRQWVVPDILR